MKEGLKEGVGKFTTEVTPQVTRQVTPQVMETHMLCEKPAGWHYIQVKLGLKDSSGLLCPPLTTNFFSLF
jgi:hypothetical protein